MGNCCLKAGCAWQQPQILCLWRCAEKGESRVRSVETKAEHNSTSAKMSRPCANHLSSATHLPILTLRQGPSASTSISSSTAAIFWSWVCSMGRLRSAVYLRRVWRIWTLQNVMEAGCEKGSYWKLQASHEHFFDSKDVQKGVYRGKANNNNNNCL